jgi:hypothetical protein
MTDFVFTAPDGTRHRVRGPDGSTEAEAFQILQQQLARAAEPEDVGVAEAMTRGAAQGSTFGFSDELAGVGANSPLPGSAAGKTTLGAMGAPDVLAGGLKTLMQRIAPHMFGEPKNDDYTAERDRVRAGNKNAQEQRPYSYLGGQAAGSILSSAPAASLLSGGSLASNVTRGTVIGGGLGAAQGAGEADEMDSVLKEAYDAAKAGAVTGAAVPLAIAGGRRLVSPIRAPAERAPLVNVLQKEGIDLTAGQRTSSRPLQYIESTLGDMPGAGGAASEVQRRQGQQYTQAVLKRVGSNAKLATPDALDDAYKVIGQQFDDLAARNTLQIDKKFALDVGRTVKEYVELVNPSQRAPVVGGIVEDIISMSRENGGKIPGELYQSLRSRLDRAARGTKDPELGGFLRSMRDALDGGMQRSIPPTSGDAAAWRIARKQYRNFLAIEKAATGAGEKAAEGYISPALLRGAVKDQGRRAYARGQGDLAELARAGVLLNPLPNSGTAPRAWVQGLMTGGGIMTGDPYAAAASIAAPALLGRTLMSRPIQSYLGNQIAGAGVSPATDSALQLLLGAPARQLAISRD